MGAGAIMERLQKVIAQAGIASRRAAEEIILEGRVRVNGRVVTELGAKADPHKDKIEVDGKRLVAEAPVYVVLHKPKNVVSTLSDPEGRPTVAEYLRSIPARLYPVGRLDFATSGVLLATNDGEFTNGLLHPRGGVPKTYVVKVHGVMGPDDLEVWRRGVRLEDGMTLPAEARMLRHEGDKTWFEVDLREGRNQQIRRMGDATGFPVMRLARVSFAGVTNEGLRPGDWRHLTKDELLDLRKQFGVPRNVRAAFGERAQRTAAAAAGGSGRGRDREAAAGARARRAEGRPAREETAGGSRPPRRSEGRPAFDQNTSDARPPRRAEGRPAFDRDASRPRRPDDRATGGPPRNDARGPAAPAKSGRSGRSETTPRGAEPRASRARGRGDR
jgi:23S rRNA pseudouridine2605 synthase